MEWQGKEDPKLVGEVVLKISLLPKTHHHQKIDEGEHMCHEPGKMRKH
jgi:hypothetical protein